MQAGSPEGPGTQCPLPQVSVAALVCKEKWRQKLVLHFMVFSYPLEIPPPGTPRPGWLETGGLEPDPPRGLGAVLHLFCGLRRPLPGTPLCGTGSFSMLCLSHVGLPCGSGGSHRPPPRIFCSPGIHTPVSGWGWSPWAPALGSVAGHRPREEHPGWAKLPGQETQEDGGCSSLLRLPALWT